MADITAKDWPAALAMLAARTPESEIKKRPLKNKAGETLGAALSYVDARFVFDRLDEAVGAENWQSRIRQVEGGNHAGIGILVNGRWLWKWDGGDPSDIEGFKGSISDSLKRAGVQWGIARDLYDERSHSKAPASSRPSGVRPAASRNQPPAGDYVFTDDAGTEDPLAVAQRVFGEDGLVRDDGSCPVPGHGGAWKHVPAGTSKSTGKAYGAFWACPERGCRERPAKEWIEMQR